MIRTHADKGARILSCALLAMLISCEAGVNDLSSLQSIASYVIDNGESVSLVNDSEDFTAPEAVTVTENSKALDSSVLIEWTNPEDEDFFGTQICADIEDLEYNGHKFPVLVTGASGKKSAFFMDGLENLQSVTFTLHSVDSSCNVEKKGTSVTLTPKASGIETPAAPATIESVSSAEGLVNLSWTLPQEEIAFVKISADPAEGSLTDPAIFASERTEFIISGLTPGKRYSLTVSTFNSVLEESEAVTYITVLDTDKTPPKDVEVKAESREDFILLTWTDGTEEDLKGYIVTYGETEKFVAKSTESTLANSCAINNIAEGTKFTAKVQALDTNGNKSAGTTVKTTVTFTTSSAISMKLTAGGLDTKTNKIPVSVSASTINSNVLISRIAYKLGLVRTASKLLHDQDATDITETLSFEAEENGTYSVAAKDTYGNVALKYITIGSIDSVPPEEPAVLSVRTGDSLALIAWRTPKDKENDFWGTIVEVLENGSWKELTRIPAKPETYCRYLAGSLINGSGYTFRLRSVDVNGNASKGTKLASLTPEERAFESVNDEELSEIQAFVENGTLNVSWQNVKDFTSIATVITLSYGGTTEQFALCPVEDSFTLGGIDGECTVKLQTLNENLILSEGTALKAVTVEEEE